MTDKEALHEILGGAFYWLQEMLDILESDADIEGMRRAAFASFEMKHWRSIIGLIAAAADVVMKVVDDALVEGKITHAEYDEACKHLLLKVPAQLRAN